MEGMGHSGDHKMEAVPSISLGTLLALITRG